MCIQSKDILFGHVSILYGTETILFTQVSYAVQSINFCLNSTVYLLV